MVPGPIFKKIKKMGPGTIYLLYLVYLPKMGPGTIYSSNVYFFRISAGKISISFVYDIMET
jgi:hypothetical protein